MGHEEGDASGGEGRTPRKETDFGVVVEEEGRVSQQPGWGEEK